MPRILQQLYVITREPLSIAVNLPLYMQKPNQIQLDV